MGRTEQSFPKPEHDHTQCMKQAVARARNACESKGVKFTKLREQVFTAIAASHTAIGAYDIIERLAKNGKRMAPISMYRILEALSEVGIIHRLESRNSYFACYSPHQESVKGKRRLVFLVCNQCDRVLEIDAPEIGTAIEQVSESADFQSREALLEIAGICRDCT